MSYAVTAQTEEVIRELRALSKEIDGRLLPVASLEARVEWQSFQRRAPSDEDIRREALTLSPDELAIMLAKVRRFREILVSLVRPGRSLVGPGFESVYASQRPSVAA